MSKTVMLKASYVVGRVLELVERQCRNSGRITRGVFGRKAPRVRLVSGSAVSVEQLPESTSSTRIEYAIPLTDNNGQFFAEEEIAAVLMTIAKAAGGFSCSMGPRLSFGETVLIDLVLWSSAV